MGDGNLPRVDSDFGFVDDFNGVAPAGAEIAALVHGAEATLANLHPNRIIVLRVETDNKTRVI